MALSLSRAVLLSGVACLAANQACGLSGAVGDSGFGGAASTASSPDGSGGDSHSTSPSATSSASQGQGGTGATGSSSGGAGGVGGSSNGGGGMLATSSSSTTTASMGSGMGGNVGAGGTTFAGGGSGGGGAPTCGNGVLDAGERCDDGNTNDGDGCSATCQLEAAFDPCGGREIVLPHHGDQIILLGNTTNAGNDHQGTCGGGGNPNDFDLAYAVHIGDGGTLTATLSATFSSVVYTLDGCPNGADGPELACNATNVSTQANGNHDYLVVVDGTGNAEGAFTLTLSLGN